MIAIGEVEFELNSSIDMALRRELIENASIILTSFRGTIPQDRGMGLVSGDIIGRPVFEAKGAYTIQAIEQIDKYEPRLSVEEIRFEAMDERLIPKVVITYNGS